MPKIIVLGSNGFVGKNLIAAFSNRSDMSVVCASHADVDLLDGAAVAAYFSSNCDAEIILHCVAFGGNRSTNYDEGSVNVVENNLRMFFNVVRCLKSYQRLIYMGSGSEYGRGRYLPKMKEQYFDAHLPADAYGFAKYAIAKFVDQHENMLDLRIFGLYGQGEDYRYKFISNSVVKALLGLPITIAQNVVFDYLYINDFVRLVERMLDVEWPYRHMNITPTESIDLLSIAGIVNMVTGNTAGISVLNPGLNTEYTGDNKRLLEVVGPFSFTPHERGIRELTQYHRSVWNSLDFDTVRADPYIDKCIVKK